MSMRVRDLQQYLSKFTDGQKGTAVSDLNIYIETQNGHLEVVKLFIYITPCLKSQEVGRKIAGTYTVHFWHLEGIQNLS